MINFRIFGSRQLWRIMVKKSRREIWLLVLFAQFHWRDKNIV